MTEHSIQSDEFLEFLHKSDINGNECKKKSELETQKMEFKNSNNPDHPKSQLGDGPTKLFSDGILVGCPEEDYSTRDSFPHKIPPSLSTGYSGSDSLCSDVSSSARQELSPSLVLSDEYENSYTESLGSEGHSFISSMVSHCVSAAISDDTVNSRHRQRFSPCLGEPDGDIEANDVWRKFHNSVQFPRIGMSEVKQKESDVNIYNPHLVQAGDDDTLDDVESQSNSNNFMSERNLSEIDQSDHLSVLILTENEKKVHLGNEINIEQNSENVEQTSNPVDPNQNEKNPDTLTSISEIDTEEDETSFHDQNVDLQNTEDEEIEKEQPMEKTKENENVPKIQTSTTHADQNTNTKPLTNNVTDENTTSVVRDKNQQSDENSDLEIEDSVQIDDNQKKSNDTMHDQDTISILEIDERSEKLTGQTSKRVKRSDSNISEDVKFGVAAGQIADNTEIQDDGHKQRDYYNSDINQEEESVFFSGYESQVSSNLVTSHADLQVNSFVENFERHSSLDTEEPASKTQDETKDATEKEFDIENVIDTTEIQAITLPCIQNSDSRATETDVTIAPTRNQGQASDDNEHCKDEEDSFSSDGEDLPSLTKWSSQQKLIIVVDETKDQESATQITTIGGSTTIITISPSTCPTTTTTTQSLDLAAKTTSNEVPTEVRVSYGNDNTRFVSCVDIQAAVNMMQNQSSPETNEPDSSHQNDFQAQVKDDTKCQDLNVENSDSKIKCEDQSPKPELEEIRIDSSEEEEDPESIKRDAEKKPDLKPLETESSKKQLQLSSSSSFVQYFLRCLPCRKTSNKNIA